MSAHGARSTARHGTDQAWRQSFKVGHVTFELADHPKDGATFALIAGDALRAGDRKPLFTGVVEAGMGTQLRRLAHEFDALEARLRDDLEAV